MAVSPALASIKTNFYSLNDNIIQLVLVIFDIFYNEAYKIFSIQSQIDEICFKLLNQVGSNNGFLKKRLNLIIKPFNYGVKRFSYLHSFYLKKITNQR